MHKKRIGEQLNYFLNPFHGQKIKENFPDGKLREPLLARAALNIASLIGKVVFDFQIHQRALRTKTTECITRLLSTLNSNCLISRSQ